MKKFKIRSLLWFLGILLFLIGIYLSTNFFLSNIEKTLTSQTLEKSLSSIEFLKTLRGYYTKNVIADVLSSGALKVHFEHQDKNTIPLPATMIHDLSEIINKKGGKETFNLYSRFPFPNRENRILDDFQKNAIEFLEKNPDQKYIKLIHNDEDIVLRVAIADKLVHSSCVNCHNTHPLTPRKGWKLNDVRGVLEVKTSLNSTFLSFEEMTRQFLTLFIGTILLVGLISFILYQIEVYECLTR